MFMKLKLLILAGSAIILSLSACGPPMHRVLKKPRGFTPPPSRFSKAELTYAVVNERVLRSNCLACHGQGAKFDFSSYEGVRQNIAKIEYSVFKSNRMPKKPMALSRNESELLRDWIYAGIPHNAIGEIPVEVIPLGPNFASIKYNVFDVKCMVCHNQFGPASDVSLETKEDLLKSLRGLVIPGDAKESGLVLAIADPDPKKSMPPLRDKDGVETGFQRVSEEQLGVILAWINSGAKD
jgi:hypothetical protein